MTNTNPEISSKDSQLNGVVNLKGKIMSTRFHDGKQYTELFTPAPDLYSHPSVYEVRSRAQLGAIESEVQVRCRLDGNKKRFNYKERATGEQKTGFNFNTFFIVIE